METDRTPVETAPTVDETPADAALVDGGTPAETAPTGSEEGQAGTPDAPSPRVEDSTVDAKRFNDTRAALLQAKQELANLKRMLTPDIVAAIQTGQQQNLSGRDLLKKQLEAHPEIVDDPITQIQYHQNMTAAQIQAMLNEHQAKLDFATEAKDMLPGVNLRDPAIDECYAKVRAEYRARGIDKNPFLAAYAVAYPEEAYGVRKGKEKAAVDEASRKAAQRMEKPGPTKGPQPQEKSVVVERDDPNWFLAYVKKNHPNIGR